MVLSGLACDDEVTQPVVSSPAGPAFKSLDTGYDLLHNLELAFNVFDATEYDKLLDENFVFFFSAADFSSGRTPERWDRTAEQAAYNNFFDANLADNRVLSRDIQLLFSFAFWTAIAPDDPDSYPGETWYRSRVTYNVSVVLGTNPELTLIANGLKAEFIIRRDDAEGQWRLIRWRDDVTGFRSMLTSEAAVEGTTWGGMKALYQ
jgi:hypothetical protein